MSIARIKVLFRSDTPTEYQTPIESDEKKHIKVTLTAHTHQQEIILKHLQSKQIEHEAVLENLQSEIKAIKNLGIYLQHIRVNSELFRGSQQSYKIAEEEMKEHPDLLREYKSFHAYLSNATQYINQLETYLKTKPPIANKDLLTSHSILNKQYGSFKNKIDLENLLEKYNRYDITVHKILTHCEKDIKKEKSLAAVARM